MQTNNISAPAERIGFFYHPSQIPHAPGHPQLDINLYGQPTHAFFDTRLARFPVVGQEGLIEHITITHPWTRQMQYRVCAGRIILADHQHRVIDAFSLGGQLEITDHGSYTSCKVTSPAPIFDLTSSQSTVISLIIEFEALLARCRACWGTDDAGFERRLASIEPFDLFVAGLESIAQKLAEVPTYLHDEERYQQAVHVIQRAIQLLQEAGNWPTPVPTLDDLCNPCAE